MQHANHAFLQAARKNDIQSMTALLQRGASARIARDQNGDNALHYAARQGEIYLCQYLIRHGASINVTNNEGLSALHTAVYNNHAEIVELMLVHGGDLTIKSQKQLDNLTSQATRKVIDQYQQRQRQIREETLAKKKLAEVKRVDDMRKAMAEYAQEWREKNRAPEGTDDWWDKSPWREFKDKNPPGTLVHGSVTRVFPFGVYMSIDGHAGIEGIVTRDDMSWSCTIDDPENHFVAGQRVEALVKKVLVTDEKVMLSTREVSYNPWKDIESRIPIHSRVKITILNITTAGAIAEVEKGVFGIIRNRNLAWKREEERASDYFKVGEEHEAIILNIYHEQEQLDLGYKQLRQNPWEVIHTLCPIGDIVYGEVNLISGTYARVELPVGIYAQVNYEMQAKDLEGTLWVGKQVSGVVRRIDIFPPEEGYNEYTTGQIYLVLVTGDDMNTETAKLPSAQSENTSAS